MLATLQRPRILAALIAGAGLGALAMALVAQYWGGLQPCVLCIYQRYAHAGAAGFGLLALALAARPPAGRVLAGLGGLAYLAGAGIAAYHVGVEQAWWQGTAGCHAPAFDAGLSLDELREAMFATRFVPCDVIAWELFGVSMAGYNLLFSLALGVFVLWAVAHLRHGRANAREAA